MLPTEDKERAKYRLWDYFYGYFPQAQLAKTKHSYESNIKHCGTEGMEWASEKSVGDGNQIMRHLVDGMSAAANDDIREAEYHLTCLAWRADELLERLLNKMPPFEHLKSVGMYAIDYEQRSREAPESGVKEKSVPMSFKEWINSRPLYDPDMCDLYEKYEADISSERCEPQGDANG